MWQLGSVSNEHRCGVNAAVAQDGDANNEACVKSSAKSPNPVSFLRPCSRTAPPQLQGDTSDGRTSQQTKADR